MESSSNVAPGRSSSISSSHHCMCPYLWGCGIVSPSNRRHQFQQEKLRSRFHHLGDISDDDHDLYQETSTTTNTSTTTIQRSHSTSSSSSWRDAIKKLAKEWRRSTCRGKKTSIHCCCYSSRPINKFGYDAASYFKNFDDGCTSDDDHYVPPSARVPLDGDSTSRKEKHK